MIDRSNMAVAIVAIAKEYDYTKQQQGLILSAFFFGYIMTQILGGAMADRYGAKPVLAIGICPTSVQIAYESKYALIRSSLSRCIHLDTVYAADPISFTKGLSLDGIHSHWTRSW